MIVCDPTPQPCNAVRVAGGHQLASPPPPPQHPPHANIWSFQLIYPFGDQRSNQCNQSNNAWRILSLAAAARGITILITRLCGIWGCFTALSFFFQSQCIYMYIHTPGKHAHIAARLCLSAHIDAGSPLPSVFPSHPVEAAGKYDGGFYSTRHSQAAARITVEMRGIRSSPATF